MEELESVACGLGSIVDTAVLPACDALYDDVIRCVHEHRRAQFSLGRLQNVGECDRLGECSRESVEQEPRRLANPLLDHRRDERVGYELPSVHALGGLSPELRVARAVFPEQVARGDVREGKFIAESCRLRAFADPGRTDEHEP